MWDTDIKYLDLNFWYWQLAIFPIRGWCHLKGNEATWQAPNTIVASSLYMYMSASQLLLKDLLAYVYQIIGLFSPLNCASSSVNCKGKNFLWSFYTFMYIYILLWSLMLHMCIYSQSHSKKCHQVSFALFRK